MDAHHDLEFMHSLAIKAGEHQQESKAIVANEQLDSSVKDDKKKNENSSPVIPKGKRTSRKKKSPEAIKTDGSDQNVWNSRLRPRDTSDVKQRTGRCGSASGSKAGPNVAAAVLKKLSVSLKLSLSKKEINEDILLMTGKKPSQKPKKRTRAEKKRIPGLEMGSTLIDVCVDKYEKKEVDTCKEKEY